MALNLEADKAKKADPKHEATEQSNDKPAIGAEEMEQIIADRVAAEVARRDEERSALVAEEVRQQLAALTASLNPTAPGTAADGAMLSALAEAIYAVSNEQDVSRRRVPPEEMAKRVRAREEMEKLIAVTLERGTQPVYILTKKCYLGERIIEPYWVDRATRTVKPTEIGWWGIPNEFMHPVNIEAEAIHRLFLESIDSHKKVDRNQRVTPGGLVVRSGGLNPDGGRDVAPRVGRDVNEPSLTGRNGDRPEVLTRILGTLLPPARQMV